MGWSTATLRELPDILPIFPLAGVLLLPRGRLPLNIFEPRYLAMIRDAWAGSRLVGMVQPRVTGPGDEGALPVFATGCAGRIANLSETEDGRLLITLTGICRFDIKSEAAPVSGYRRVVPDWSPYQGDLVAGTVEGLDHARLAGALTQYFAMHGIQVGPGFLDDTPDEMLITALAMACPFEPGEKQALLECPSLAERCDAMIALIEMALFDRGGRACPH